jgi:hypothetical protein
MMVGLGTDFWGNAIFVLPENALLLEAEFLDTNIKIFPVILSLCGGSIAFIMYNHFFNILYRLKLSFIGRKLYTFFNRKWFFDKVYNEILAQHTLTVAYEHGYQNIDRGIIELLGPNGVWILFSPISNSSNYLSVYHLEILKKLRNFFKILFITFIFIYFIIFGYWFLNDYTQYINFFFNKNTDITPIDFFSQKENFFISNFISDIQFNSSWVDQLNNIINNSLNTGDSLGLNFLAQYFNIDYFAIDLNKLEKPYLPFSEKWVDNLDYFRNNIPVHDENGVFIAQNYTNFVNQFLSKDLH